MKLRNCLLAVFCAVLASANCMAGVDSAQLHFTKLSKPYRIIRSSAPITDYSFSPNGNFILCGDDSDHLTLWNLLSGKKAWSVTVSSAQYCFSPNGKILAIAVNTNGSDAIQLRDTISGRLIGTISSPYRLGMCIKFSPDGKLLAAAASIGRADHQVVLVFNITTRKLKQTFEGHIDGRIWDVGFSGNGSYLAAATYTTCAPTAGLAMWNSRTAKQTLWTSIPTSPSGLMRLHFFADGRTLAFLEFLIDYCGQHAKLRWMLKPGYHACIGLYSEKTALFCNKDNVLELWDLKRHKLNWRWTGSGCSNYELSAFSCRSKLLAVSGKGNTLNLWSLALPASARSNSKSRATALKYYDNGRYVQKSLRRLKADENGDARGGHQPWRQDPLAVAAVMTSNLLPRVSRGQSVYRIASAVNGHPVLALSTSSWKGTYVERSRKQRNAAADLCIDGTIRYHLALESPFGMEWYVTRVLSCNR